VLLVAGDTFRAAAADQLEIWAERSGADIVRQHEGADPASVVYDGIQAARSRDVDVIIVDTAGRLHVDEALMEELVKIKASVNPSEILLTVDAMLGQDAVNVAKTFNDLLDITGVVLTKMDGDTRGGAALSVKYITGKPIKFVGMGEKMDAIELFHPDRMASRILGMGDILSLIEKAEAEMDVEKAKELEKKMRKAEFDFNDFLEQMQQMKKMGGLSSLISMLPGANQMQGLDAIDDDALKPFEAIIQSMTMEERTNPSILNPSRKNRIARGAGVDIAEVNRVVKQFEQSRKMMKQMSGMMKGKGKFGKFKMPFGF
jgi:signal recognition particle subunit SRP54